MKATTQLVYQEYKRIRSKHPTYRAIDVKRSLEQKQHTTMVIPWEESRPSSDAIKQATMKVDGFTVHLKVVYDWDYDWLDSRGKFTGTWQQGAITNPNSHYDNHVYKYFVPDCTEDEQYRDLRKMNFGKSEARELAHSYVMQDMQIASDPDKAGYYCVGVTASVYKQGIELGSDSLWGIELACDDSNDYVSECAIDVLHQAISDAKSNLKKLVETEK